MKKLSLILMLLSLGSLSLHAQESNASKRQERKEAREAAVAENAKQLNVILQDKEFYFYAQKATSSLPRMKFIDLSSDNYNVVVKKDDIYLDLPYYGVSQSLIVDRDDNPVCFKGKITSYKISGDLTSKIGQTIVVETQGDDNKFTRLTFYIFDNSTARLVIQKQGLTDIEFSGKVEEIPQNKSK
ncbi:MAG: DUF4251 domain-containing protein [Rikenellaceae bacterium]